MSWDVWSWKFRLESPLHVGFHKVMHLFRTRLYVPGRMLWGAVTAKLTPILGLNDYTQVGKVIKSSFCFGYMFPYFNDKIYLPVFTEKGVCWGGATKEELEQQILNVTASTAVESSTLAAEEATLHEVEFVSPYQIPCGVPVYFKGILWVREYTLNGIQVIIDRDNKEILFKSASGNARLFSQIVDRLQIGGERRYGFGLIKHIKGSLCRLSDGSFGEFPGKQENGTELPKVKLEDDQPFWTHLKLGSVQVCGDMEPLTGREWDTIKGAGRNLSHHGLFWTPGSILKDEDKVFEVHPYGWWKE